MTERKSDSALDAFRDRISGVGDDGTQLVPAATVVLLRDTDLGPEVLMLRKNSKIAFGGMWVFPGGKIDASDGSPEDSLEQRARLAVVRETHEETALELRSADLVWFSHWTPPPMGNRRFNTWFFAARTPDGDITIDEGEITESQWITAATALQKQASREIELAPPTYVTLHYLSLHGDVDTALAALSASETRHYATRIVAHNDELFALWEGDAGYEDSDADIPGPRHRLHMKADGFHFDDSALKQDPD